MSENFSPRKLSEDVNSTASRVLKGLQVPHNIPRAKLSREELSDRVLEKAAQIRERVQQLARGSRNEFDNDIQSKIEARIKENKKNTQIFQAKERAAKITARAQQVMENPRDAYEEDIKRRVEARILESKNKARLNKAKDMAARITRRAQQVMENPRNEYDEDIKRRVEAGRAYNSQPVSEKRKLIQAAAEDKASLDLDEDVVSYQDEGVPLKGNLDIDKTQEVDMDAIFAKQKHTSSTIRQPIEKRAVVNRQLIEEKQKVRSVARDTIRGLGFEASEVSLMLDEDFVARLKKRGYTGGEASILASIAKEKANDLRSYFKVMGVTIDRYGEPDLGFLKKLGGLFGGYNKKVLEIKQSEDFKRMKLLDMLALDADEVLSAPRRSTSAFGKKAVLAGVAAAAIGGAVMKGKGQPDAFSSRAVAAHNMKATAEKATKVQTKAIPAYDFTESEAGYAEDFDQMTEKEYPEYTKVSVPEVKKVDKKQARRDATMLVEKAKYSEKAMSTEVKMNMLEDFFASREFRSLPREVRQNIIFTLAGGSIVLEPIAFKESLDNLRKSISKLPDHNKKMTPNEQLQYYKGLMSTVDVVTKRKLQ